MQQLTATIIPPPTVNMMSWDEDHCSQYKEHGHIARNCPDIRCFECDEYGHIVMDCPHRIPPLGTPAKLSPVQTAQKPPHQVKLQTLLWRQGQEKPFQVTVTFSHTLQLKSTWFIQRPFQVVTQGNHPHPQSRSQCSSSTYRSYSHQSHHDTPHWWHQRSSVHSSSYHSRDWSHSHLDQSYKSPRWDLHRSHLHSSRSQSKPHHKKNTRVKIEDPHMDYYSSDDHSSNSGEETDHKTKCHLSK